MEKSKLNQLLPQSSFRTIKLQNPWGWFNHHNLIQFRKELTKVGLDSPISAPKFTSINGS
ncbi:hypothetical protein COLO4_33828 [Corchorus olitorius]|uniref:Uncharacterized protein n=1 Tax=Corchorus olitorius TaxID=93759 RepID=A0A1R3GQW9_9ROSI|nr:hypothetical protein COLO4_33828 [Corchorus olitorius]